MAIEMDSPSQEDVDKAFENAEKAMKMQKEAMEMYKDLEGM